MASIYSKQGKIWVSFYQDGKRIRKSTKLLDTKHNRKKVERELLPKLEQIDFTPKKTVGYYYKVLMQNKQSKESTVQRIASAYNRHIEKYSDRAIDSFKRSELKQWISSQKVSPKTLQMNVSVFKQIFDEAIDDEAIYKNHLETIRLPKLVKFEPEPFSEAEVQMLLANASGWFRNFLALLFMSGMRIGEAIALEWEDVDEFIRVDKSIRQGVLGRTKTENIRYVPVFDDLKPFLQDQRLKTALKGKRVFPGLVDSKDLRQKWHKLLKTCNMEHRILYQARHTFAIQALDSGLFKVSYVAKMLGHSSVKTLFEKYAKYIKSEADEIPKNFSTLGTKKGTKVV